MFNLDAVQALMGLPPSDFRTTFDNWVAGGAPGSPLPGLASISTGETAEEAFERFLWARPKDPAFPGSAADGLTVNDLLHTMRDSAFLALREEHAWEQPQALRTALAQLARAPKATRRRAATYWALVPDAPANTFWPIDQAFAALRATTRNGDFETTFEAWVTNGSPLTGLRLISTDETAEDALDRIALAQPTDPAFPNSAGEPFKVKDLLNTMSDPAFLALREKHAWEEPEALREALAQLARAPKATRRRAATYWALLPEEPASTFWPFDQAIAGARAETRGIEFATALDYRRFAPPAFVEEAIPVARKMAMAKAAGRSIDLSLLLKLRNHVPDQPLQTALDMVEEVARRTRAGSRVSDQDLVAFCRMFPDTSVARLGDFLDRAAHPGNEGIPLRVLASLCDSELAPYRAERDARAHFRESAIFSRLITAAVAHEPNIVPPDGPSYLPPWHDADYFGYAAARALLPDGPVQNVVLVPFGKLGGADYVAGILAAALAERGPTVILRTDRPDWDRPDWYPDGVPAIDLSGPLSGMADPARALFALLRALGPEAVWNVNSRTGFECLAAYGERLADSHRLYAYYFCADRTTQGQETGYPVWFMADILPHLHAALVDTRSLADTLVARYAMPPALAGRMHTLHTPAQQPVDRPPLVAAQIAGAPARLRPVILWAGRLDRQKRFDLVEAVARAMPDVAFRAWGKAVLGKAPGARKLPANLTLDPPFASYDDLPLSDCDGWLYTAAWDGLPTILIECGAMGMPIVASAVGGVPELIDDTTGWPVEDADDPEAYVRALRQMLADPEARRNRATALQDRVRTRHSPETFRKKLESIG